MRSFDLIVLGAGAAGLMCAIEAARRGRKVVVLDHASKPAEKIRISGGGKCNFTHLKATPKNFLSQNPHFCISALKRFTPWDFVGRVIERGIPYYEKTEGQLFCETSAQDIIDMLLDDLQSDGGELWLKTDIRRVDHRDGGFVLDTSEGIMACEKLVVATGGLSIPKMGATGFAYDLARQFGHEIIETRPALVPFTLGPDKLEDFSGLSGVAVEARVTAGKTQFTDGFLFTHRGLSGPAILQISSYWRTGEAVEIDLLPGLNLMEWLLERKQSRGKQSLGNALAELLPRRLSDRWLELNNLRNESNIGDLPNASMDLLSKAVKKWTLLPMGTEGYRTAEVTAGGIDTNGLSSQTMESRLCPGLYFIGECVDVTGWLGGYNFQWAWSSGWAAGQAV
ncbi:MULTISPECIES: NAD(P)/FAD-dependent oxidoreductase [Asticcacaulis]|uniref:NAD(P)/FAD-dependent oxidoreductase n=1 Tax=Asticcacaulis TaxID=76890 RepID=UPI001AE4E626|nr:MULTISPECIES: NAD(P)/FAD-dependent oxidoreductase [Asticcacaulis]MBP2158436.1 putative Rossmann fold flavoprotein [Asticcacaulis solisilvae]MDR6799481.1 putative Rossmann fold flavoprotein [Asticcacaulis sp. BE141]